MAAFSGNIISAKFIDFPENMTIEVLYHENDIVVPYILGVDFTQSDFNDLLKEITLEAIQTNTRNQIEAQNKELSSLFNAEIERRWGNEKAEFHSKFNTSNSANKIEAKDILLQLTNKAEDKDFIFNMKVAILEDLDIAKSKDKDMKLAIRKAKSLGELLRIYYSRKLD
mgnify:CR=1 FL=1